jgi:hypothetical protein
MQPDESTRHTVGIGALDALRAERDAATGPAKAALTRRIRKLEGLADGGTAEEPSAPKRAGRRADIAKYRKGAEFEAFLASELRAACVTADALTPREVYAVADRLVADNVVLGCPARWAGVWATEPVLRCLRKLLATDTDTPAPPHAEVAA